jgi:3-hydroxyacyl-[acyl-carrier-protein] dehydratase
MGVPDKMKATHFEINELIPQRPPMLMIGSLITCDKIKSVTEFFITDDNIFRKNGFFTEPGMVENIAQTAAAGVGYHAKMSGQSVHLGFIASIKDLNIYFLPVVNSTIYTEICLVNEVMGFSVIQGKIISDTKIAAVCEMRIFIKH